MRTQAPTVGDYLAGLPADRRGAIATVRETILRNLPRGYREAMNWGMVCYEVPLETYPDTYNGKPLMYAALASQKNHMAIYLCNAYGMPALKARLVDGFTAAGKKLDHGASCVRFRRLEDLSLSVIAEVIAATPVAEFVAHAESMKRRPARRRT